MKPTSEYALHRLRGQCGSCASPPAPGLAHCRRCLDVKAARVQRLRDAHRANYNAYMRRWKAAKKAA